MEYGLVLLWLLTFHALALVGLPLTSRLFPKFPDRGATFALPISLVVVTTVVYWIGHLAFGRWTAYLGSAVLIGLSLLVFWSGNLHDSRGQNTLRLRVYMDAAVVFTVAFLFLVAVRAVDPAFIPGGGEKFLDFGILKSLMRANGLPPEDMWWAGDHVLYYYGGHLMAATLSYLTGTAPQYGYNLALAGFYASLVTAAYGLAAAMADAWGTSSRLGGILGGFFVGFASNLVVPVTGLIWLLPDSVANDITDWVASPLQTPTSNGVSLAGELIQDGLDSFGYWAPSRVIPGTINEFPLFAFLNGDLHGHMLSTQFMLLVAALGFAYYRTPPSALRRRRGLVFGAIPLAVALITIVNTWSVATALGVAWLALLFAPADPLSLFPGISPGKHAAPVANKRERTDGGGSRATLRDVLKVEGRRLVGAFAATSIVTAVAVVLVLPFVLGVLLQSATNRSIAFLPTPTSAMGLVLVHGAFLLIFTLYLWLQAYEAFSINLLRFGLLIVLVIFFAGILNYAVLALVVPLVVSGWLLLRTDANVGFETVLLVAGAGLVTLVEFIYVKDSAISGRFNTVFKVYMQVWILWSPAAGAALAILMDRAAGPADWSIPTVNLSRSDIMAAVTGLLVVSTGLYGVLALQNHFTSDADIARTENPTLNGTAYLDTRHPFEAEAIRWLDAKRGQPTVVTAPGRSPYSWSSPVPSLTGLPAVIGWVYQESVYRGEELASRRAEDVDLIYQGRWSDRAELLKKYDIRYIYVGPIERKQYPNTNLDFSKYPGIKPVFQNKKVTIYRVNQLALEGNRSSTDGSSTGSIENTSDTVRDVRRQR